MSGSISSISGYGLLPTVIANSGSVHARVNTLTEQVSTGLVSQTYAGLGSNASVSLTLGPKVAALQTYNNNINQVSSQLQVTQAAMTQIEQIGSTFASSMPNLSQADPGEIDNIASNARQALVQVAELLDTQDNGSYVFGGQDMDNPPVPNPDDILSSGFFSQINSSVSSLATNGGSATAAATLAIASSNTPGTSPFSAYMSQPQSAISRQTVQVADNAILPVGLVASANTASVSDGSSTTGSYMRDLMRSLATIGSLSSSQSDQPGFDSLMTDTTTSINGAVKAMASDAGALGDQQAYLTNQGTVISNMQLALTNQASSVQDVDMASAISQLTSVQTQLQESYRLIVNTATLSLVNYL